MQHVDVEVHQVGAGAALKVGAGPPSLSGRVGPHAGLCEPALVGTPRMLTRRPCAVICPRLQVFRHHGH